MASRGQSQGPDAFSVGREEVPLTQQMGYGHQARCCTNIDDNRRWPLGPSCMSMSGDAIAF